MAELRLVIFDVDGTLVDSLAHIKWAMSVAFKACDLPEPDPSAVRGIIGLSLPVAMDRLHGGLSDARLNALVAAYGESFRAQAEAQPETSFFPGAIETLHSFAAQDDTLLAVATGKSRRGMDRILLRHGLGPLFQSVQVADDHPSKPNPSMVAQCLRDTGVDASRAVIVGDTTFDLEMGRAGGVATIGVDWGYHDTQALRPFADHVVDDFDALFGAVDKVLGQTL